MDINCDLDNANFILYCAKFYDTPIFDTEEFYDDLKRIKYIKRLFNKYKETGDLKERLLLNHIIILYNVFGPLVATRILFFKLPEFYEYLTTFLDFLGYLPKQVRIKSGSTINTLEIEIDLNIRAILESI